ncbi:MAG: site-2 protease family protein [Clostridia bacterium]|nr:site-2 protease family protein [Clostridia bacterium]
MTVNLLSIADVMKSVGSVLVAVLILLAMVTVHEFGHYVAGKILHFKITEFSVGFGPAIFKKRSKKTGEIFALRVIPLGGYCAFDGEDYQEEDEEKSDKKAEPFEEMETEETQNDGGMVEVNEKPEEGYPEPVGERFDKQAPWKRIIVLVAGATMNYLFALILLFIMAACFGVPKCIVMPTDYKNDTTVEVPHAAWEEESLSQRDVLLRIEGDKVSMMTDIVDALRGKKAGENLSAEVLRKKDGEWLKKTVFIHVYADGVFADMGNADAVMAEIESCIGYDVYTTTMQSGFWDTVGGTFAYSWDMATAVLKTLGQLLTGQLGLEAVGGPVTTIGAISQATGSWFSFLYIASFIGVNLAVFNLLPIPALDGCKVIFCLIEWIRKKPVNRKVETLIHFIGIIFLFGFAILVDILQLF